MRLITPTDRFRVTLRRWRPGAYSESLVELVAGEVVMQGAPYNGSGSLTDADFPTDDPRWPSVGLDGVAFAATDDRYIDRDRIWTTEDGSEGIFDELPAGSCFEDVRGGAWDKDYRISRQYREQHQASRGVFMVKLPGPAGWFSPDWAYGRQDGNAAREGWTVTGGLRDLQVSPSINRTGEQGWHGWCGINGTPPGHLSRDLDGRPW